MRFDTKIAIAVRSDLAVWQKLNVTAFLSSGIAAGIPEVAGKPYEDGSGNTYLEMFRQPVLVYAGSAEVLAAVRERAVTRGMPAATPLARKAVTFSFCQTARSDRTAIAIFVSKRISP